MERHVTTLQAYSDDVYACLLGEAGFGSIVRVDSLGGAAAGEDGLFVPVARARPGA